jgi:hypothetical protein
MIHAAAFLELPGERAGGFDRNVQEGDAGSLARKFAHDRCAYP